MKSNTFNFALTLSAIVVSQALFMNHAVAAIPVTSDCGTGAADSLTEMFTCGTVSGSLRTLYYSTHNAYFVPGYSQDTVSYGGSVKYATAEYYGLSLGVSGILQRGISHNDDHLITELGSNQTGVGEAYLSYHYQDFRITAVISVLIFLSSATMTGASRRSCSGVSTAATATATTSCMPPKSPVINRGATMSS